VHRPIRLELHDHRLGADREAAGEHVVVLDRCLQVHQAFTRFVVARVEFSIVLHPGHPHPGSAVERFHEQGIANLARDLFEAERLVVFSRHVWEPVILRWFLMRDHPRVRHLQAQPHHGAVSRVLLHGLERERVVHEVDVVHDCGLLQPLTRDVVPVREPIDDERMARHGTQVEGLDRDALGRDRVVLPTDLQLPDGAVSQCFERARPILFGAQQQADQMFAHTNLCR
jgi:hypothetical protein